MDKYYMHNCIFHIDYQDNLLDMHKNMIKYQFQDMFDYKNMVVNYMDLLELNN